MSKSWPGKPYYVRYAWRALIFLFAREAKTGPRSQPGAIHQDLDPSSQLGKGLSKETASES